MKIALISDQHIGAKQDSIHFHDHIAKFYSKQFFPYLEKNNIKKIIMLGDTFDRRKYINYVSLSKSKEYYFDKLEDYDVDMIVGNHDCFFNNTNWPNSPSLLLQEYDNIKIIASPYEKEYDGRRIVLMPWITSENEDEAYHLIQNTDAVTLFGHLDVAGFAMNKGYTSNSGIPFDTFDNFELVCSGHFHHKSTNKNISYLGSPYEITWADYDDPKGFHIYDTETNKIEFVANTSTLFKKIYYDDSEIDYFDLEYSDFANSYIKLVVKNKTNHGMFDNLVDELYKIEPIDLKVIEDFSEFSVRYQDINENVEGENTFDMLKSYVNDMQTNETDKKRLNSELQSLYLEALDGE